MGNKDILLPSTLPSYFSTLNGHSLALEGPQIIRRGRNLGENPDSPHHPLPLYGCQ